MTNDSDLDLPVSAREGDVEVTKSFDADRFPVPAITFVISSGADDPIRFRLVDEIPDSFSMEGVGFHPDFESDNWTAYRDHRVEYVRTLDPGEEVETVYGIRVDDLDRVEEFVQPPTVTLLDEDDDGGDAADGVLGRDTTRAVRDALSGEQGLAGLDEEPILEGDDAPAPRSVDPEAMPAVTRGDAEAQATVADEEAADVEPAEAVDSTADDADSTADSTADASGETDPEPATELDGVAAALADEIRAENVDDDDLALLREELDVGAPKSVDVRIGRLQSQIEDLLAYREALAEFLDDHGTADELLEEVRSDLDSVESRLADVDASLSAAATERTDLREDVTDVHDAVEDVESRIDELDAEMGEVREDVADLDGRLVDVEEDVRDELDEIRDELDDLREFRDRLSNAFGTE